MPSLIRTPLTPEQRQLAEENHNLIYEYISQRKLELNDWYDELAIALCQAARNYDPSRGSFSTCAFFHFRSATGHRFAREARQNKLLLMRSLSDIVDSENGNCFTVDDITGSMDDNFDRVEWEMVEEQLLSRLSPKDQIIYRMRRQGYLVREIAGKLGITHQAVCARLNYIRRAATNT